MLQKFSFIFHLIGTMYFGDDIISSMFISRLYIMPACESDPVWISPRYRFKKTRTKTKQFEHMFQHNTRVWQTEGQ